MNLFKRPNQNGAPNDKATVLHTPACRFFYAGATNRRSVEPGITLTVISPACC